MYHHTATRLCRAALLCSVTSSAFLSVPAWADGLSGDAKSELARVSGTTIGEVRHLHDSISLAAVRNLVPTFQYDPNDPVDEIVTWHIIALNQTAVDHTVTTEVTQQPLYFEQYGPTRTSRGLAIVHLAMFEVANAFAANGVHYVDYLAQKGVTLPAVQSNASEAAAIITAAYTTLIYLYPNQQPTLQPVYNAAIAQLAPIHDIAAGQAFGQAVANAVIALRQNDNSSLPEPYWGKDFVPLNPPVNGVYPAGQWTPDPVSNLQVALGGNWPKVTPFVLTSGSQFRSVLGVPPTPNLNDPTYRAAYDEVEKDGGDPRLNTSRPAEPASADHYYQGKFWSYDATGSLCAPPRLYNEIADEVLAEYSARLVPDLASGNGRVSAAAEVARYYALLNVGMADAAIGAWDGKYHFQYWRPVTGVRSVQALTHAADERYELWYPLGAQQTNSITVINITPPFPAFPSGHATFGGLLFGMLKTMLPNDHGFRFQSDEFNGPSRPRDSNGLKQPNVDVYNFVRCKDGDNTNPAFCSATNFRSFDHAEQMNGLSRVWLGVHWRFDSDAGIRLGEAIGQYVMANAFQPAP